MRAPLSPNHDAQVLWERLRRGAGSWGIDLTTAQIGQYQRYLELLLEWNQRFNLTAIEASDQVVDKHFLDSLSCSLLLGPSSGLRLVDVGTGAGFPGLVLKIAFPDIEVLLLDAVEKRLRFLERAIAEVMSQLKSTTAAPSKPAYERRVPSAQ